MIGTIVEIVIGLVFVYVLLSLLVTQLNNIVVWATRLRANVLFVFVRDKLLQGELGTILQHPLLNLVEENGAIKRTATYIDPQAFALTLSNATVERVVRAVESRLQGVDRQQVESTGAKLLIELKDPALTIQNLQSLKTSAANLPAGGAKQAITAELDDMIRVLTEYQATPAEDKDARLALLQREVQNVNNYALRTSLSSLLETVETFDDTITRIGQWFDDRVAETSKVYSRRMAQISFILGLICAIVINADSLYIARVLWDDSELRQQIVVEATDNLSTVEELITSSEEMRAQLSATEDPAAPEQPIEAQAAQRTEELSTTLEDIEATIALIESTNLPVGWSVGNVPTDVPGFLLQMVGWVITALATTLGAPFWFDILRNLTKPR